MADQFDLDMEKFDFKSLPFPYLESHRPKLLEFKKLAIATEQKWAKRRQCQSQRLQEYVQTRLKEIESKVVDDKKHNKPKFSFSMLPAPWQLPAPHAAAGQGESDEGIKKYFSHPMIRKEYSQLKPMYEPIYQPIVHETDDVDQYQPNGSSKNEIVEETVYCDQPQGEIIYHSEEQPIVYQSAAKNELPVTVTESVFQSKNDQRESVYSPVYQFSGNEPVSQWPAVDHSLPINHPTNPFDNEQSPTNQSTLPTCTQNNHPIIVQHVHKPVYQTVNNVLYQSVESSKHTSIMMNEQHLPTMGSSEHLLVDELANQPIHKPGDTSVDQQTNIHTPHQPVLSHLAANMHVTSYQPADTHVQPVDIHVPPHQQEDIDVPFHQPMPSNQPAGIHVPSNLLEDIHVPPNQPTDILPSHQPAEPSYQPADIHVPSHQPVEPSNQPADINVCQPMDEQSSNQLISYQVPVKNSISQPTDHILDGTYMYYEKKFSRQFSGNVTCRKGLLSALIKGYLTRRLLKTEKIKDIVKTIKDAKNVLESLTNPVTLQDVELQQRVANQLHAAKLTLHRIFFTIPSAERMRYISQSRSIMIEKLFTQLKEDASELPRLSSATIKSLERKNKLSTSSSSSNANSLSNSTSIKSTTSSNAIEESPRIINKRTVEGDDSKNLEETTTNKNFTISKSASTQSNFPKSTSKQSTLLKSTSIQSIVPKSTSSKQSNVPGSISKQSIVPKSTSKGSIVSKSTSKLSISEKSTNKLFNVSKSTSKQSTTVLRSISKHSNNKRISTPSITGTTSKDSLPTRESINTSRSLVSKKISKADLSSLSTHTKSSFSSHHTSRIPKISSLTSSSIKGISVQEKSSHSHTTD